MLFVGQDTKLFLNLKQKPPKASYLDEKLNKLVLGIFLLNMCCIVVLCGLSVNWVSSRDAAYKGDGPSRGMWYLTHYNRYEHGFKLFVWRILAFFVMLSFTIPISLFITMELNKAAQAIIMMWDTKMAAWHNGQWKFCRPRTSELNEQLALMRFLFTDKTGTLTENRMNYIGGTALDVEHDELTNPGGLGQVLVGAELTETKLKQDPVYNYLLAMTVCHSVMCFDDADDPSQHHYEGQSPDECALVRAAKKNLFELVARSSSHMIVDVLEGYNCDGADSGGVGVYGRTKDDEHASGARERPSGALHKGSRQCDDTSHEPQ